MEDVPPFDDKIFSRRAERTLAIIKNTAISKAKEIEDVITNDGFTILQKRRMKLSREQARDFYAEYEGKTFFSNLIDHITSGPILVLVLERPNAVSRWKTIIGPTEADDEKLYYAKILRDVYNSLKDPKNAIHGSDSAEKAEKEIHFFFPDSTLESILTGDAARDYLSRTVNPILLKGLVQLCRQKPENPVNDNCQSRCESRAFKLCVLSGCTCTENLTKFRL